MHRTIHYAVDSRRSFADDHTRQDVKSRCGHWIYQQAGNYDRFGDWPIVSCRTCLRFKPEEILSEHQFECKRLTDIITELGGTP
jgi:hypothetical protein